MLNPCKTENGIYSYIGVINFKFFLWIADLNGNKWDLFLHWYHK
jgi:hypothetical protein